MAYLALASETFSRGLARSSLSRWLCSRRRLSLSSDIDCLPPPRVLIVDGDGCGESVDVREIEGASENVTDLRACEQPSFCDYGSPDTPTLSSFRMVLHLRLPCPHRGADSEATRLAKGSSLLHR